MSYHVSAAEALRAQMARYNQRASQGKPQAAQSPKTHPDTPTAAQQLGKGER